MGVFLGYHFMDIASRVIKRERLGERSFDVREGYETGLSEAAGVYMRVDGPYVTGRVDDKTLRGHAQAKAEEGVR